MFKVILDHWRSLNITAKFGLGFGLLLVIGVLELAITRSALQSIRDTEQAIQTSMETQRLSLEMSRNWQEALNFQSDFFLQYPVASFDNAYRQYAIPAGSKFAEVIQDGAALKRMTSAPTANENLRQEDEALKQYLSRLGEYMVQLEDAVQSAADIEKTQVGLSKTANDLYLEILNNGQSPAALTLYYEMRLLEKEFLNSANSNSVSLIIGASDRLRQYLTEGEGDTSRWQAALALLDEYDNIVGNIIQANAQLQRKLDVLESMAEDIEPNHNRFTLMAQTEVDFVRNQIEETRHNATITLIFTNASGLLLVGLIILILNRSIIQNILKLTDATRELQKGNLFQQVQVDSNDELGKLAMTFNTMADEISQMIGHLELIHQASLEMARDFEAQSIADIALDTAMQVSLAESGYIALCAGPEVSVVQVAGKNPGVDVGNLLLETGETQTKTMHTNEIRFLTTFPTEEISIPLLSREKWIGAIHLKSANSIRFQENSLKFLNLLALRTAVAIDNAQMYREVQNLSVVDSLTGVYNRRGFFELGERELVRTAREKHTFSTLFIDIDSFKAFNDRYGYDVGDLVLSSTVEFIKKNVRSIDIVGRYGGEEFVVLLPGLDLDTAIDVAERLRSGLASQFIQTQKGELVVTASIGVSSLIFSPELPAFQSRQGGFILRKLIDSAGDMLREAKTEGRNRVMFVDRAMMY